jgi:hypothetical protein
LEQYQERRLVMISQFVSDLRYAQPKACLLDLYLSEKSEKTLLFLHGGGLVAGSKSDSKQMFQEMNTLGISVISADYSMYPDTVFPSFLKDSAAAVKWMISNQCEYHYAPEYYILGESAGAYIAAMLRFDFTYLEEAGVPEGSVSGFLLDDPQPTTHYSILKSRNEDPKSIVVDEGAPIAFVSSRPGGKVSLISYDRQKAFPARWTQNALFSKTMEQFGVPHEFLTLPGDHCSAERAESGYAILPPLRRLMNL